jgi:repressor LexA
MNPLTPAQSAVLDFIRQFLAEQGLPPTRAELAQALGYESRNTADFHIKALVNKGYLESIPGARGLKLIEEEGVPLIGKVAAGAPILAQENILGRYQIDQALFKGRVDYLLEVRGESMTGAGIFNGDWIGVRKSAEARSGQIAVVRVDDEVTVKTLRLKGSRAELHPANPDYQPIIVDLSRQQFAIEGIPVGLIRRFK